MGFQIEEYGKYVGMPTYKTQSFDHEGHSFSLSLILDTKMVLHAYDDNVWYNKENKLPVEIAVLIDDEVFEDMDVAVELVGSDLELGNAMHHVLNMLHAHLTIL